MKTTLLTSVAVFALTAGAYAPSANALSAGVFQQSGNNIRVLVSHRGEPTQVELFAVDAEYNRVDARVFPATFTVTDKARRVSVKAPKKHICCMCEDTDSCISGESSWCWF